MQSDKASKKSRKNASAPAASSGTEKKATEERTAPSRNAKSSLSKSESAETTSAMRHRKAATVSVPETAIEQQVSQPKTIAAAVGGNTVAAVAGPVTGKFEVSHERVQQERIQELAYQFWVADGKPHGNHHEHWLRAERELELVG